MQFINVAEDKWLEHSLMLDNLFKYCQEIEPKLWLYFLVMKNEDLIRKLIAIVGVDFYLQYMLISDCSSSLQILTVNQQRSLLEQTPPKFIVETNMLMQMLRYVQQAMTDVMRPHQQQQPHLQQQQQLSISNDAQWEMGLVKPTGHRQQGPEQPGQQQQQQIPSGPPGQAGQAGQVQQPQLQQSMPDGDAMAMDPPQFSRPASSPIVNGQEQPTQQQSQPPPPTKEQMMSANQFVMRIKSDFLGRRELLISFRLLGYGV
jgi:hypothetical protein